MLESDAAMHDLPSGATPPDIPLAADPLREALLDSRQRWRDLVAISSDFAFETDAEGRFVFLSPDSIMQWPSAALLGRPSETLLPEPGGQSFNPFAAGATLRHRRVWLKRPDGTLCWMSFSAAPMIGPDGTRMGSRGVARDVTEFDATEAAMARALRRSELIDHIVWHMRTEILAPRMMKKALQALIGTLGADGAMIVESRLDPPDFWPDPDADDVLRDLPPPGLLHQVGGDLPSVRDMAIASLRDGLSGPAAMRGPDGHGCLVSAAPTRFEGCPGLVIWRMPSRRPFDADDLSLLGACIGAIRIVLEHGAIQQEMARQARTDSLTGLFNRRAFIEDIGRRLDRLEREHQHGSLMFIDLDNFKSMNDGGGHEAGDAALRIAADVLRQASRPGDMVARLGGDEFAIWYDGMDELAAAERADLLCRQARNALPGPGGVRRLSMSVGIASRWPGSGLDVTTLLRRADDAMYDVKRTGRGYWKLWKDDSAGLRRGDGHEL